MITVKKLNELTIMKEQISANFTIDAWEFHKNVKFIETPDTGVKIDT